MICKNLDLQLTVNKQLVLCYIATLIICASLQHLDNWRHLLFVTMSEGVASQSSRKCLGSLTTHDNVPFLCVTEIYHSFIDVLYYT